MTIPDKPEALRDYPVVFSLPVQWGDQDAFGHVNNIVYFRWFESARIAYIRDAGISYSQGGTGIGPILATINCHFRKPVNFPDTVHIGARISRLGNSSMTIDHAVYSEAQDQLVADGDSVVVLFDYTSARPHRIPDEMRQLLESFEGRSLTTRHGH
jgi:acyl-CoA thioester hydrolase